MNATARLMDDADEGADEDGQETFKQYFYVVVTIGARNWASCKRVATADAGATFLASVRDALTAGASPVNNNKWRLLKN